MEQNDVKMEQNEPKVDLKWKNLTWIEQKKETKGLNLSENLGKIWFKIKQNWNKNWSKNQIRLNNFVKIGLNKTKMGQKQKF